MKNIADKMPGKMTECFRGFNIFLAAHLAVSARYNSITV